MLASEVSSVPLIISDSDEESDEDLAARLQELAPKAEFFRTVAGPPSHVLLRAAAQANLDWIDAPFSAVGRLELTRWTREQSVTETRHRYGNIFNTPFSGI
jgi:RHH-type proline utilization regulon transcriptional repressor/proline dehydrogenase/delta 1-pyrroline-5-carboxylate dehydrogenase